MNAPLMNDDSSNNTNMSCGMKRSSPDNGASAANKCQRIDESMIGKQTSSQDVLTTTTSSASAATSSIDNYASCDGGLLPQDVATDETTSIIIDNIFSNNTATAPSLSSSSQRNNSIQRRQQAQQLLQQSKLQAVAPPLSQEAAAAATSSTTLSAPTAAIRCKKSMVQSPHDFFTETLKSRGYPATTSCSLKSGYHSTPTVSIHTRPTSLLDFATCFSTCILTHHLNPTNNFLLSHTVSHRNIK